MKRRDWLKPVWAKCKGLVPKRARNLTTQTGVSIARKDSENVALGSSASSRPSVRSSKHTYPEI